MKNFNENFCGVTLMSEDEMSIVNGGESIWETIGYLMGVTAKTFYMVGKIAGEYQGSLPPSLKK